MSDHQNRGWVRSSMPPPQNLAEAFQRHVLPLGGIELPPHPPVEIAEPVQLGEGEEEH